MQIIGAAIQQDCAENSDDADPNVTSAHDLRTDCRLGAVAPSMPDEATCPVTRLTRSLVAPLRYEWIPGHLSVGESIQGVPL